MTTFNTSDGSSLSYVNKRNKNFKSFMTQNMHAFIASAVVLNRPM